MPVLAFALCLALTVVGWMRPAETCSALKAVTISNVGEEPLSVILVKRSGCEFLIAPVKEDRVLVLGAPPRHGHAHLTEFGIVYAPAKGSWAGDALTVTEIRSDGEHGRTGTVAITVD